MFVQELRITHSDQTCLSLASGWKKGYPPIHFLRVFSLDIKNKHFEYVQSVCAKKAAGAWDFPQLSQDFLKEISSFKRVSPGILLAWFLGNE